MKKSSKSSLKTRSINISLQHKNKASYKFSKKNFCTWQILGLALNGLIKPFEGKIISMFEVNKLLRIHL